MIVKAQAITELTPHGPNSEFRMEFHNIGAQHTPTHPMCIASARPHPLTANVPSIRDTCQLVQSGRVLAPSLRRSQRWGKRCQTAASHCSVWISKKEEVIYTTVDLGWKCTRSLLIQTHFGPVLGGGDWQLSALLQANLTVGAVS